MKTFTLVYRDDSFGCARRMEFDAHDAYAALKIAHAERAGRTAELWLEGRMLCTLKRVGLEGTVWEIGSVNQRLPVAAPTAAIKPETPISEAVRPAA